MMLNQEVCTRTGKHRRFSYENTQARLASLGRILVAGVTIIVLGAAGDGGAVNQGLTAFQSGQFAEALQRWQQAATAGDARGALYVGVLYDTGLGVAGNKQAAMDWYRRAAEAGSAAGAFNVGVLYDSGLGVAVSREHAAAWYARAAESGYGRAEYNLGMLYEEGTGVPRDRLKAAALFARAADHGIAAARSHLARIQPPTASTKWNQAGSSGSGNAWQRPPQAQDKAMRDFQQAQQILLTRGPAEASRAAALFRQAAAQHNPLAEYDLAYCYERGLGVPRDPAQAYYWYRRSLADASDEAVRTIAQVAVKNLEDQVRQAQLALPRSIQSP